MNECAENFCFLYNKKILKEMKKEYLKTQWMNLHPALYDGNSHDINSAQLFSKHKGFTGKHFCRYWYTLCNINQVAWNFLSPEPEVTWHKDATIIWVVLLSPYFCICGVSLASIHYSQSCHIYINWRHQYICLTLSLQTSCVYIYIYIYIYMELLVKPKMLT